MKRPREEKWEIDGHVDRDVWLEAGRQGLLLVDTPDDVGGIGGDFLSAMIGNHSYH